MFIKFAISHFFVKILIKIQINRKEVTAVVSLEDYRYGATLCSKEVRIMELRINFSNLLSQ